MERGHSSRIASFDQPIASLIYFLKSLFLLDDTLFVWSLSFGLSPDYHFPGSFTSLFLGHILFALPFRFEAFSRDAGISSASFST